MIATLMSRRFAFENSAATALIAASMPPMPRPVTMRQVARSASRGSTSPATNSENTGSTMPPTTKPEEVAMYMPVAMTTRQPSTVGRRPILSASPPRKIEPSAMPMSSADSTKPSACGPRPHSERMPGDAKLIDSTSKPSSAFRKMVIAMMTTCIIVIGDFSSASRGSLCTMSFPPSVATGRLPAAYEARA